MVRGVERIICLSAAGLLIGNALAPAATADTTPVSRIGDTSHTPYVGKGVLGTMGVSGLNFTRPMTGDYFTPTTRSEKGSDAQGELIDGKSGLRQCPFVRVSFLTNFSTALFGGSNVCQKFLNIKDSPGKYVKQVNHCKDGVNGTCVDGKKVDIVPGCNPTAFNKFGAAHKDPTNVDFPAHGSGAQRPVGKIGTPSVYFRYTWRWPDGKGKFYSQVRSDEYGWVWVRRKCLKLDPAKSPEGGAPKTKQTVAGLHPNLGR